MNWFEGIFFCHYWKKKFTKVLRNQVVYETRYSSDDDNDVDDRDWILQFFFVETALSFHGILNYTHTLHEEKFEKYKKYKS